MSGFIERWLAIHKPGKPHPERTVKSYAFQEAESTSRTAKVAWCKRQGHAVLSLQHDGVMVAFTSGTDPHTAAGQMSAASSAAVGYEQPSEVKSPDLPAGLARPARADREGVEAIALQEVGQLYVARGEPAVVEAPRGMWDGVYPLGDTEQYAAAGTVGIWADPVLRLHLRSRAAERGPGVRAVGGRLIRLDAAEATVMRERTGDGVTRGTAQTTQALWASLELHAIHHFTHAIAVDGSMRETVLPGRRLERRVAFGVYEGLAYGGRDGTGGNSEGEQEGLWGGRLPSDCEVIDAELTAIHEALQRIVCVGGGSVGQQRVLIQSDCLGALDSVEAVWRVGRADSLRGRDRGAMLESICRLRKRLDRVIFLYTPSHKGHASNAMADAVAKTCLGDADLWCTDSVVAANCHSRPCLHSVDSDFTEAGLLRSGQRELCAGDVVMDRRLFPLARRRIARWLHSHLVSGLSDPAKSVDVTFVGRRAHECETSKYVPIAVVGTSSAKLDKEESEPVERMAEDSDRVSIVMAARNGKVLGAPGAHDEWWRRKHEGERRRGEAGEATRFGGLGCTACQERQVDTTNVCDVCNGWQQRGRRGRVVCGEHIGCVDRRVCSGCGGGATEGPPNVRHSTPTMRRAAHAVRMDGSAGRMLQSGGWAVGSSGKRRLGTLGGGEDHGSRWVGFAGLARTVVERLVERGGTVDEDSEAATPIATVIADVQHVLGGECAAMSVEPVLQCVRSIARTIRRDGGVASELHELVDLAEQHLLATPSGSARDGTAHAGWEALRRLLACDVPRPDWLQSGGLTPSEERQAWLTLDRQLKAQWKELITAAVGMRQAWKHAAAPGLEGHRRREASRGVMRVILRAWREATDDVRAGAAKWEARWHDAARAAASLERPRPCVCGYATACRARLWEHMRSCARCVQQDHTRVSMVHHTLARRLAFPSASLIFSEAGWRARMVLSWLRLVRAGKVRVMRRASPMWMAAERDRVRGQAETYRRQTAAEGEWQDGNKRMRGHAYGWGAQESVAARLGATSGAAAVVVRREAARVADGKRRRSPSPQGTAARRAPDRGAPAVRASAGNDAALVVSPCTLVRALCVARGRWRVPRQPFGDG